MSANSIKGRLTNIRKSTDALTFQYNPKGISDSKSARWAEAIIPGGDNSLATFGSGTSLSIKFELFFNSFGEGARFTAIDTATKKGDGSAGAVERAINFLYRFTETSDESSYGAVGGNAPPVLLLQLGSLRFPGAIQKTTLSLPVLPVRLTNVAVKREMFSKDFETTRARVQITLVRHVGFPQ